MPAAALTIIVVAAAAAHFRLLIASVTAFGRAHAVEFVVQLVFGGGKVLQQLHFMVKMQQESLVGGLGDHLVDKFAARGTLSFEGVGLTAAGVDQQTETQRLIDGAGEALDRLRLPILGQRKVVLLEVGDDLPLLIAHRDWQNDFVGLGFDGQHRLLGRRLLGQDG